MPLRQQHRGGDRSTTPRGLAARRRHRHTLSRRCRRHRRSSSVAAPVCTRKGRQNVVHLGTLEINHKRASLSSRTTSQALSAQLKDPEDIVSPGYRFLACIFLIWPKTTPTDCLPTRTKEFLDSRR